MSALTCMTSAREGNRKKEDAHLDISHLLYFKTVVEAGSISQAARALFISQPALSASVAKIEADVGVPLFTRTGRRIILNEAGSRYYESVVKALDALSQGKQDALSQTESSRNRISLAGTTYISFSTAVLPFWKLHPDYTFKLWQLENDSVLERLLNDDLDFCMTCKPVISPNVNCYQMLTQKLYLTVPEDHPFASRRYVNLAEAKDERFVLMRPVSPYYDVTSHLFAEAGFTPNVVCDVTAPSMIPALVQSGVGISLLPDTFNEHRLCRVNISNPKCNHNVYLAWMKNRNFSQAAQAFLEFILDFYKSLRKSDDTLH